MAWTTTETFPTIVNGIEYTIMIEKWFGKVCSANAYIEGIGVRSYVSHISTEDAILKLVKKLEEL